jgi:hypothetical protein
MRIASGDKAAAAALEAGPGERPRDPFVQCVDALAEPRPHVGQGGVGVDLVLDHASIQEVGVHEPDRPSRQPRRVPEQREPCVGRRQRIRGVGRGSTDAEQPELGPTVGVLEGETGAAHESKAELGNPGLPVVELLVVDGAHGAIAEQLHVPPGGGLVDLPLLGNEIRQRREGLGRRQPELDVRDACVFGQLVGDAPAGGRGAIPAPVLVLERDPPGAQLLDSAQEGQRDLREIIELVVTGHEARVRGRPLRTAEAYAQLCSPGALPRCFTRESATIGLARRTGDDHRG